MIYPPATTGPEVIVSEEPKTFEAILNALEAEVQRLERGDLPLEEALAAFERGMDLARRGGDTLAAAERKVELLLAVKSGQAETRPFDAPE